MRSNVSSGPERVVDAAGGTDGDPRLTAHLREYLGVWPPAVPVQVIGENSSNTKKLFSA